MEGPLRKPLAFNRNKDTPTTALATCSYDNAMANEKLLYVAICRKRSDVMLYPDDCDLLPAAMGRTDYKAAALNLRLRDSALGD
jgi:hypothetical protein